ncbi:MAG: hypothetical protein ABIR81_00310 [Ginsengibacter sp.]
MKKLFLYALMLGAITISCRKIEVDGTTVIANPIDTSNNGGNENTILEGRITANRTLSAAKTYKLRGLVYVTNGAILTIEPGTKIVGELGKQGGLIITRSSKIIADGTADKPIVFTSEATTPARGDWSGLVILGNAPTNASFNGVQGVGAVEGGINNSDNLGLYGTPSTQGQNPADNSGILRYVRIEYAGYAFLPDNEINGLTLGGVGNGTIIDYVQVSYANDDSFEWFGGTVNATHLIAYKGLDDEFDTDNGYSGTVQFGISIRDSAVADISKSNGFESDNDANGSALAPITTALFSNMTMVGPLATATSVGNSNYGSGAHLRRNTKQSIYNSVIMGYPTGLLIDGSKGVPTDLNINTDSLQVQNTTIAGCRTSLKYAPSTTTPTGANIASITNWFTKTGTGNQVLDNNDDVKLTAPFNYASPDVTPMAGSPLLGSASFTDAKLSRFTVVDYRGAVGSGDTWYAGWTSFK